MYSQLSEKDQLPNAVLEREEENLAEAIAERIIQDQYPNIAPGQNYISASQYKSLLDDAETVPLEQSTATTRCTLEDVQDKITVNDLQQIIQIVANKERLPPSDILRKVARKYSFHSQVCFCNNLQLFSLFFL